MRKIISIIAVVLVAVVIALTLVTCGNNDKTETETSVIETETSETQSEPSAEDKTSDTESKEPEETEIPSETGSAEEPETSGETETTEETVSTEDTSGETAESSKSNNSNNGSSDNNSSSNKETAHTHSYDIGTVTKAATCTSTGIKTYTCKTCGSTKTEVIPVIDHIWTIQTVHHDAVTHEEQELVTTAYNETTEREICDCGYDVTNWTSAQAKEHLLATGCGGSHTEYETVHHDAVYQTVTVTDKEAYDETVTTCSVCGAAK